MVILLKVGYAFVVGDLLHIGHLKFFQNCKKHCDYLIVGVYNDELVATYKREPIIPFKERVKLVKALRCVDKVIKITSEDTPNGKDCTPILKRLTREGWNISVLFHGDDWIDVEGREYIESIGGKLILTPYYHLQSTTKIIEKIKGE